MNNGAYINKIISVIGLFLIVVWNCSTVNCGGDCYYLSYLDKGASGSGRGE